MSGAKEVKKIKFSADSFKLFIQDSEIQRDDNHEFVYLNNVTKTDGLVLLTSSIKHDETVLDESGKSITIHYLGVNDNDDEGYTPLCFAAMNGIPGEVIACLVNNGAETSVNCFRGKSAIECACLSMHLKAAEVLFGKEIEYTVLDEDGKPIKDSKIIINEETNEAEEVEVDKKAQIKINEANKDEIVKPTQSDFLTACSLAKGGDFVKLILNADIDDKQLYLSCENGATYAQEDKDKRTALELACFTQCYDSIDAILAVDAEYKDHKIEAWANHLYAYNTAYEHFSALALNLNDLAMLEKFVKHWSDLQYNTTLANDVPESFTDKSLLQIAYNANSLSLLEALLLNLGCNNDENLACKNVKTILTIGIDYPDSITNIGDLVNNHLYDISFYDEFFIKSIFTDDDDVITSLINECLDKSDDELKHTWWNIFSYCVSKYFNKLSVDHLNAISNLAGDEFSNCIETLLLHKCYNFIVYLLIKGLLTDSATKTKSSDTPKDTTIWKDIDSNADLIDVVCSKYVSYGINKNELTTFVTNDCYNIINELIKHNLLQAADIEYLAKEGLTKDGLIKLYIDNKYYDVFINADLHQLTAASYKNISQATDSELTNIFVNYINNADRTAYDNTLTKCINNGCTNIVLALLNSSDTNNKSSIINALIKSNIFEMVKLTVEYSGTSAVATLLATEKYTQLCAILYSNILDDADFKFVCNKSKENTFLLKTLLDQYEPSTHAEIFEKFVDNGMYHIVYALWQELNLGNDELLYINDNEFFTNEYFLPNFTFDTYVNDDIKCYNIIWMLFISGKFTKSFILAADEFIKKNGDSELLKAIVDHFDFTQYYSTELFNVITAKDYAQTSILEGLLNDSKIPVSNIAEAHHIRDKKSSFYDTYISEQLLDICSIITKPDDNATELVAQYVAHTKLTAEDAEAIQTLDNLAYILDAFVNVFKADEFKTALLQYLIDIKFYAAIKALYNESLLLNDALLQVIDSSNDSELLKQCAYWYKNSPDTQDSYLDKFITNNSPYCLNILNSIYHELKPEWGDAIYNKVNACNNADLINSVTDRLYDINFDTLNDIATTQYYNIIAYLLYNHRFKTDKTVYQALDALCACDYALCNDDNPCGCLVTETHSTCDCSCLTAIVKSFNIVTNADILEYLLTYKCYAILNGLFNNNCLLDSDKACIKYDDNIAADLESLVTRYSYDIFSHVHFNLVDQNVILKNTFYTNVASLINAASNYNESFNVLYADHLEKHVAKAESDQNNWNDHTKLEAAISKLLSGVSFKAASEVNEDQEFECRVRLITRPTDNVTVHIISEQFVAINTTSTCSIANCIKTLTFTKDNYNKEQTIKLNYPHDHQITGDKTCIIKVTTSSSGDDQYNDSEKVQEFEIMVKDKDKAP